MGVERDRSKNDILETRWKLLWIGFIRVKEGKNGRGSQFTILSRNYDWLMPKTLSMVNDVCK